MKEGFIKLDGQDNAQKIFYELKQKVNNKTLADMPKIQQRSHECLGDASVLVSSLLFQGGRRHCVVVLEQDTFILA